MAYNSRISHRMSLIAFIIANSSLFAATAGFDVLVTDADSGIPIEGVEVVGWFGNDNGWRAWTESAPTYSDRKTTMHPQPLFVKRMGWRKNHDGRGQNARARLDPRAQTRPEFSAPAYDFWYNIHNRTGETKTNSKKEKNR